MGRYALLAPKPLTREYLQIDGDDTVNNPVEMGPFGRSPAEKWNLNRAFFLGGHVIAGLSCSRAVATIPL